MKQVFIALDKKQGKHFLIALLLSKACSPLKLRVVEVVGAYYQWYFSLPDSKAVWACWYGFIAGKKFGYTMGGFWPDTYTRIFPPEKKKS